MISRKPMLIFGLITLIYALVRLYGFTEYGLWTDEVYRVQFASTPLRNLLSVIARNDAAPPLFYIILKGWIALGGTSLMWLRFLPIVASIITVFPLLRLCRVLQFTDRETIVALILTALNAFLVKYAQDVSMYSFLFLFGTLSLWLFFLWLTEEKLFSWHWACWTAANVLLVFTHYFSWLLVGSQVLLVVLLKRERSVAAFLSVVTTAVCFSPWGFYAFEYQLSEYGLTRMLSWIEPPTWRSIVWFYGGLNGSFGVRGAGMVAGGLFFTPIGLSLLQIISCRAQPGQSDKRDPLLALLILATMPVLIVFIASKVLPTSIWAERGLIFCATPYLMLVTVAACRLQIKWVRTIFISGILAWALAAGLYNLAHINKNPNWNHLAQRLVQDYCQSGLTARIYCTEDWLAAPLLWALQNDGLGKAHVKITNDIEMIGDRFYWLIFRNYGRQSIEPTALVAMLSRRQRKVEFLFETRNTSKRVWLCRIEPIDVAKH
ncbi:MAG: glycosyltransferase family 39 protein [Syntrophales bacterium]